MTFQALYLSNGNSEKDSVCLNSFRRHHVTVPITIREFKKENFLNDIHDAAIAVSDDLKPHSTDLVIFDDTTFFTRPLAIQPRSQVGGALRFPETKEIFMFDKFDHWGQKVIATKSGLFISSVIFTDLFASHGAPYDSNIKERYLKLTTEYPEVGADCIFSLLVQDFGYSIGPWEENSRFENNLGRDLFNRWVPIAFDSNRTILSNHFII